MKDFIKKISGREHLTKEEAASAMRIIMEGNATDAQIAAFLIALKLKGEHVGELAGFVEIMREKSVKITLEDPDAIDMCGTGGDASGTFNISTVASFVVAGAGVTVAKHGNRSVSSSCGSADVLKALGVNIELSPEKVEVCVNTTGIGFLFAPLFHPAMKYAAKSRADLGVKTCFNMLGPMTNPAGVQRQVVGTYSSEAAEAIASVYSTLHPERIFVVHAHDGLDEISLQSPTTLYSIVCDEPVTFSELQSSSFGLPASTESLRGGTASENANIALEILHGTTGTGRNIVLANAAAGLVVAGKADTFIHGVALAEESIDSGRALAKLNSLIEFTNR